MAIWIVLPILTLLMFVLLVYVWLVRRKDRA
jgi:hypothetical protein